MTGFAFLADVALKSVLILAAATAVVATLRGSSAAFRHMLWTLAFASVAALPVLKAGLPGWSPPGAVLLSRGVASDGGAESVRDRGEATAPQADASAPVGAGNAEIDPERAGGVLTDRPRDAAASGGRSAEVAASSGGDDARPVSGPAGGGAVAATGSPDDPARTGHEAGLEGALPWAGLLVALWGAGVLAVLGRKWLGLRAVRRLERRCKPIEGGPVLAQVNRLAREAGIPAPRLLRGPEDLMPMAWGVLRPTIALPAAFAGWHPGRVRAVLRHEIAHLRRRDPLSQWLADVVCALHWYNPFAWHAAGRLRAERELACDDEAIADATRPSDYAAELVGVARTMRAPAAGPALPMARPSQLSARVQALLDDGRRRAPVRRASVFLGACVSALVVAPLAAAAPADARLASGARLDAGAEGGPAEAPAALADAPADRAPSTRDRDQLTDGDLDTGSHPSRCWEGDWHGSRTHNVNDERHRLKWESGDCELDLRLEGDVRFTRELDGIDHMGPGARFLLREDDGGVRRELEAAPARDGAPVYTFRLSGRSAPFDADARRWFAAIVLQLARHTAFGAEQRVAGLLRDGGPDAVLDEIPLLGGDWVRSVYFGELADQAELDDAHVERALRLATSQLESDHYLATVAGDLAGEGSLTPGSRDALLGTIAAMDSDHYKAAVTERALDGGALGPRTLATLLDAVERIDSDHYKASILTGAARSYALDAGERDAYVRVARSMDSDHYRSEVLNALLDRGGEGVAEAVAVATADAMDSDHYAAEVMVRVASLGAPGREAQRAFVRAVSGIDSDHYRTQILRALLDAGADDPEQVATVLVAARAIDSDHYLAETLTAVAERVRLEGPLRDAFEETMSGIDSEIYYARVSRLLNR